MDLNSIELKSIDKLFEYEKQSRVIENLDIQDLKKFSKLYCKMYLHQQEILANLKF